MKVRPSDLYGIADDVRAFYFDRAVATFGLTVEADLDKVSRDAKTSKQAERRREMALNKWLGVQQRYKDPMGAVRPEAKEQKKDPAKEEAVEMNQGPVSL